ncbi:MAG: NAD(P)-dependent methylenetetrahydromethanopterin dehydrogenase [Pirellulales bacterium]
MSKPKILLVLDSDPQPSVFDSVVAIDAGVDRLLRHAAVRLQDVQACVHGAIFTRGGDDLRSTAIFVGGSDVAAGEALLAEIRRAFFGPMRVSVMLDPNGANTTAAAAVLAASRHLELAGATTLVLAATGPVGQRVVRLLAARCAQVRVGSRSLARAQQVCQAVAGQFKGQVPARLSAHATGTPEEAEEALAGAHLVIAAGAAAVALLSDEARRRAASLQAAIDLNAVPPAGLAGVEATDGGKDRDGVICYGAMGVGRTKMKIHKAGIRRLFDANDQVLDAEELYALGREMKE